MSGEKVLLVDDEEDFIEALSARLTAREMSVDIAKSGSDALMWAAGRRYDLIVLDLAMPGMDGLETLRNLRKSQADVSVILLTGHATVEKTVEAMKLGALDLLEKPANLEQLLKHIREGQVLQDELQEQQSKDLISDILRSKGW